MNVKSTRCCDAWEARTSVLGFYPMVVRMQQDLSCELVMPLPRDPLAKHDCNNSLAESQRVRIQHTRRLHSASPLSTTSVGLTSALENRSSTRSWPDIEMSRNSSVYDSHCTCVEPTFYVSPASRFGPRFSEKCSPKFQAPLMFDT